jgi:hypothetical protein
VNLAVYSDAQVGELMEEITCHLNGRKVDHIVASLI